MEYPLKHSYGRTCNYIVSSGLCLKYRPKQSQNIPDLWKIIDLFYSLELVQKKYDLDIRIIYRENKLHPDENNWLEKQIGVRTSICKNLHAKCYLNENEAIITSMNLYGFSQQNNNEMGIYISKSQDPELYIL